MVEGPRDAFTAEFARDLAEHGAVLDLVLYIEIYLARPLSYTRQLKIH